MNCDYPSMEQRIIDLFLSIESPWVNILRQQLNVADYKSKKLDSAYFISFSTPSNCIPICNIPRVPLSIVIEFGNAENMTEVHYGNVSIPFSCSYPSPIECNIHIEAGFVREIEVYTLTGDSLHLEDIFVGKKHFLVRL